MDLCCAWNIIFVINSSVGIGKIMNNILLQFFSIISTVEISLHIVCVFVCVGVSLTLTHLV